MRKLFYCGGGYPLLITVAALMDFRRIAAFAFNRFRDFGHAASLFEGVSYLLLAEWIYIIVAAWKLDWCEISVGKAERAFGLVVVLYALFGVVGTAHWPTMAVCFLLAARLMPYPNLRWLTLRLAAVACQNLSTRPELDPLHAISAYFDAWSVHHLLEAAGFANELHGTVLLTPNASFSLQIMPACATSSIVPAVLTAFLIFLLGRRPSTTSMRCGDCRHRRLFHSQHAQAVVNGAVGERRALLARRRGTSILSMLMCAIGYLTASAAASWDAAHSDINVTPGNRYAFAERLIWMAKIFQFLPLIFWALIAFGALYSLLETDFKPISVIVRSAATTVRILVHERKISAALLALFIGAPVIEIIVALGLKMQGQKLIVTGFAWQGLTAAAIAWIATQIHEVTLPLPARDKTAERRYRIFFVGRRRRGISDFGAALDRFVLDHPALRPYWTLWIGFLG